MTKRDLVDKCASKVNATKTSIEQIIDCMTLFLGSELVQNGYVKIPNLGSLSVQSRHGRNYYDMNSGSVKSIDTINTVKFTPSAELKNMIKRRNYEQD